jgi:Tol biopolymer transport system component
MVGTVAYMSPEQVRGKELDARTDLFSFGAVLYEMATGSMPFRGDTSAMICEAIVNRAPVAPVRLNPDLPAELERIINKALEKDRELRYRSAADLQTDLKRLKRDTDSGKSAVTGGALSTEPASPERVGWLKWAAIAAVVIIVAVLALWLRAPLPPPKITGAKQITHDGLPKLSLATDGNRLYFTENPPGRYAIAQVSVNGGETAPVDTPFDNPYVTDVSAERSELLVEQGEAASFVSPLWAMPVPAGSPRRLSADAAYDAHWGADGKLWFDRENDVYIADHDGGNARKIATTKDIPQAMAVSPDGSRVRFTVANLPNNTAEIWEVRSDGSNLHPVFPGWSNPPSEYAGAWTPDGRYFLFGSARDGASNIWIVPDQTDWWRKVSRDPIPLTTGPLQYVGGVVSRDGKKLFVVGVQPHAELVRYDEKSSDFVPYLDGISASDLDFSRDGQWVTYVSVPEGTLWRMKFDGGSRLQLTYPPMEAALAHWSPDGRQIAFSARTPAKPWKLFLISKDGGSPQPVTSEEVTETDPTWSPDGSQLAFGRFIEVNPEQTAIRLLDLKSHQISKLPGSEGIFGPRWSPDGRYIVGITSANFDKLMLYDVNKQSWRPLNISPQTFGYIAWSRDSSSIYFDTILSAESGYYKLRIADSKLEKLIDLKKVREFRSQFGPGAWTGLGPGDVPLLPRDISTQEIYSFDLQLP